MTKIKCVLIDDEFSGREMLSGLIGSFCPELEIIGIADSADSGYALINEKSPSLVFLDIRMPTKSGFEMLHMFQSIDFHVIFVSGFDEYALQAFDFNAVDYILKPIDYSKLIKAVNRAVHRIAKNERSEIIHFIHTMDEKTQLIKNINLHVKDKVKVLDVNDVSFITALRGYCEITTVTNEKYITPKTLLEYENLLSPLINFLRVNKGNLININHLLNYSKGATCFVEMKHGTDEIEVSRRKKTEILQFLKQND